MKKLFDYLEQLGLSKLESKLYLTLLKSGPLTVNELAEKIKINRTATYPYTTSLLKKGIIIEIVRGTRKKLIAIEPERLHYLIENKLELVKDVQKKFPEFVQTVHSSLLRDQTESKIDTKYYKGKNGVKAIYEDILKSHELRSYVNLAIMANALPENDGLFVRALQSNRTIKMFEILENSPDSRQQTTKFQSNHANNTRFNYKYLPQGVALSAADTIIYDGKVAIVNIGNKEQISGVVLYNEDYYNNSKRLFDLMWNMLPAVHSSQ